MSSPSTDLSRGDRATRIVSNVIKLVGVAVVANEVFVEPAIREAALAVAALMMMGAQAAESFVISFLGGPSPRGLAQPGQNPEE